MIKLLTTAVIASTALCSCYSQNYLAAKAWGEWQEVTISQQKYDFITDTPQKKQDESHYVDVTFMRVGHDYYEPCVRTRCRTRYWIPQVGLTFLGGAGSDKVLIRDADAQRGWRKARVYKNAYTGKYEAEGIPSRDAVFLEELPREATPVTVQCRPITSKELYARGAEVHTDWHALYAYPIAAVTAVCIDLPTMAVGNTALVLFLCFDHQQQQEVPPPPPEPNDN
ncbi:MAG: hypothetical protein E7031_02505 [Akkermansiaceae bacterium]|nr:hypothetical protein [Akkermansiaceae bacterium]